MHYVETIKIGTHKLKNFYGIQEQKICR